MGARSGADRALTYTTRMVEFQMKIVFRSDPALLDLLPMLIAARQVLPNWVRTMPRKAYSEAHERDFVPASNARPS